MRGGGTLEYLLFLARTFGLRGIMTIILYIIYTKTINLNS